MDGSFDPSDSSKDGLGESLVLLAANNETTMTEALSASKSNSPVLALESNSILTHRKGSSTSMDNIEAPQIYHDLDEQSRSVIQITTNEAVKIDRNSHFLLLSTCREDQRSPQIRYIDENSLYDITKLKGSDGRHKKGSNGEIYTALWRENENHIKLVAIKKEKGTKAEIEGKVLKEVKKLINLKHENVIEFIGMVYQPNSVNWVVMELGDCSLKEFLDDLRRLLISQSLRDILPNRQCVEYFLQIVRAMKEAHSKVRKVFLHKKKSV
jgi:hypothetical protein